MHSPASSRGRQCSFDEHSLIYLAQRYINNGVDHHLMEAIDGQSVVHLVLTEVHESFVAGDSGEQAYGREDRLIGLGHQSSDVRRQDAPFVDRRTERREILGRPHFRSDQ